MASNASARSAGFSRPPVFSSPRPSPQMLTQVQPARGNFERVRVHDAGAALRELGLRSIRDSFSSRYSLVRSSSTASPRNSKRSLSCTTEPAKAMSSPRAERSSGTARTVRQGAVQQERLRNTYPSVPSTRSSSPRPDAQFCRSRASLSSRRDIAFAGSVVQDNERLEFLGERRAGTSHQRIPAAELSRMDRRPALEEPRPHRERALSRNCRARAAPG